MIKPKVYQEKVWYYYASGYQENEKDPGVFACFVKEVCSGETEEELPLFIIETEDEKEGCITADQLFDKRKEAEKYHKELLAKKQSKLKALMKTREEVLLFALSKNSKGILCSEYEKEKAILERAEELGILSSKSSEEKKTLEEGLLEMKDHALEMKKIWDRIDEKQRASLGIHFPIGKSFMSRMQGLLLFFEKAESLLSKK